MLPNRNEEYLLKFISSDIDNELMQIVIKLGLKPHSPEYNPVYQIIDELNFCDIFKKETIK